MKQPSNDVLLEKINNLHVIVEKGFQGTHKRQDEANHATAKNTVYRIASSAEEKQKARDWGNLKWVLGFIGGGTIITVLKVFFELF